MSAVSIYLPVEKAAPVTIVHGPFGTGKSFLVSTIVICLDTIADEFPEQFGSYDAGSNNSLDSGVDPEYLLSDRVPEKGSKPRMRVLVSSMTNFAVDNMLCALLKQGYDQFLRVGNLKRISKQILPYVCRGSSGATDDIRDLESMLEETQNKAEQDAIHTAIQRLRHQCVQNALGTAFVLFYEGRLQHGVTPKDRQALVPTIPPLVFLDTAGQEKQHGKSQSFFNKGEIDVAVQLVRRLLMGGVEAESIGVIALYKTQADMLQEQLSNFLGQRSRVQVSTVDAYQGSEREVIIVSCLEAVVAEDDDASVGSIDMGLDLDLSGDFGHNIDLEVEQQPASVASIPVANTDDKGEDSAVVSSEYCDESVVGGSLSQWSMAGAYIDSDEGNEDALDCLDVDADYM
ncbi:hypothetical protein GGI21_001615 [Coemansia aciculifera]|nr:hypothetical protein GGI21_001615 [Coemansia aciculifera]